VRYLNGAFDKYPHIHTYLHTYALQLRSKGDYRTQETKELSKGERREHIGKN